MNDPIHVIKFTNDRQPSKEYFVIGKKVKVGDRIKYMQPQGTMSSAEIIGFRKMGDANMNDNYAISTDKGVFGMVAVLSGEQQLGFNQVVGIGANEQMLEPTTPTSAQSAAIMPTPVKSKGLSWGSPGCAKIMPGGKRSRHRLRNRTRKSVR